MRSAFTAVILLSVTTAQAQTQPDNATLLKAIQGLNTRIDNLQRDVDRLKNRKSSTNPSAVTPAPSATNTSKPKSIPGWLVNVVPPLENERENALAQFAGPASNYDFSMHTNMISGQEQFQYFGEGYFHASEPGRYIFLVEVAPLYSYTGGGPWQFNCDVKLSVSGNRLIDNATKYQTSYAEPGSGPFSVKHQTFSGNVDLETGDYPITFRVGCFLNDSARQDPLNRTFGLWKQNSFKILIHTPDDSAPRSFAPNELFHVVKTKT